MSHDDNHHQYSPRLLLIQQPTVPTKCIKKKKRGVQKTKFKKRDFPKHTEHPTVDSSKYTIPQEKEIRSPIDYFYDYFNDEFFKHITEKIDNHYKNVSGACLNTSSQEIQAFLGVHLVMIASHFSNLNTYSKRKCQKFQNFGCLNRNRLYKLRRHLCLVDSNHLRTLMTNKLWKIQPMLECIRNKCMSIPRDSKQYSIIRLFLSFTGDCPVKFNKNIIIYTLISDDGIILDVEFQQEKSPLLTIVKLCKTIPKYSIVFIDERIISIQLLEKLLDLNIFGCGKLPYDCDSLQKYSSEFFNNLTELSDGQHVEYTRNDNLICLTGFNNLNVITVLLSTYCGTNNLMIQSGKQIPEILYYYECFLKNSNLIKNLFEESKKIFSIRTWSVKIIAHLSYLVAINCWLEYKYDCEINKKLGMESEDFIKHLGNQLINKFESQTILKMKNPKSKSEQILEKVRKVVPLPSLEKRLDGKNHFPIPHKLKNNKCCRFPSCNKRTRNMCSECNIFLCLTSKRQCFNKFHSQSL